MQQKNKWRRYFSIAICIGMFLLPSNAWAISDWAKEDFALAQSFDLVPDSLQHKEMTESITRAEFCALALLIYEQITGDASSQASAQHFTDTFDINVDRAYELGLVGGRGNGMFMPDDGLTREEMFGLLYNLLCQTGYHTDLTVDEASEILVVFDDYEQIADWAVLPLGMMLELNLTSGANPNLLEPKGATSREQAILLALRFTQQFHPQEVLIASAGQTSQEIVEDQSQDTIMLASRGESSAQTASILASAAENQKDKLQRIYGENLSAYQSTLPHYPNEDAAIKDMVTITIPAWDLSNGKWVSKTYDIIVHKNLAATYQQIFTEIYNLSEKFPIHDIGCYAWRSGTSGHSSGTAIDINANENPQISGDGAVLAGIAYEPGVNPYAITENGAVVQIFARYGFAWGGNAWIHSKDYMHFTYFGF